jgi:hypothetical protein
MTRSQKTDVLIRASLKRPEQLQVLVYKHLRLGSIQFKTIQYNN